MADGHVVGIFLSPCAGDPMVEVSEARAIAGFGLEGDRYALPLGGGKWNKGQPGTRQVTLINARSFEGSHFKFADSRRNLVTNGMELMRLINEEFEIGEVLMRGVKYCYPCDRPSELVGSKISFADTFHDRGGLIAEIIVGGWIRRGSLIVPVVPVRS